MGKIVSIKLLKESKFLSFSAVSWLTYLVAHPYNFKIVLVRHKAVVLPSHSQSENDFN